MKKALSMERFYNKNPQPPNFLEAISKIGFWFKFSRRRLAGQERGTEFQPTDILKYFEELEFGPNTEIETKGLFEMASS